LVTPSYKQIHSFRLILNRNRPEGSIRDTCNQQTLLSTLRTWETVGTVVSNIHHPSAINTNSQSARQSGLRHVQNAATTELALQNCSFSQRSLKKGNYQN